jgi:hypothetical protein
MELSEILKYADEKALHPIVINSSNTLPTVIRAFMLIVVLVLVLNAVFDTLRLRGVLIIGFGAFL